MAKNLVEIIVTAEDKASGVLSGIGGALRTVGTVALGGIGVATGALAGFAAGVTSLASAAAPVAGLKQGFEALTSSMQGGSAAMLSALQDASGGLITNTDLMQSFNQAASLVSKDFAEQLPDAMGHLSKVAAATGQDMNYMLDSLVKGVGRLSPMILDNLGIQVNLTEANEIYAASVGKSVDELTKAEQQTALMNQVMEKLADNTEGMEGLSNPFEKFKVTMANLKDEIGLKLLPVVAPLMERFGELAVRVIPLLMRGVERLIGGMQPVMAIFDSIAVAVGQFIDAISHGESPLDALINAIMRFGVEMGVPLGKLKEIRTSIEEFMVKVMEAKDRVLEFVAPIVESISQFVSWKDILIAAAVGIAALVIPAIVSIVTSMAPIILIVGAVIAVVALLRNAWEQNWGDIQGKVAAAWDFIRPKLEAIRDWITGVVIPAAQQLWQQWVTVIWPAIQAALAAAWAAIQPIFQAIKDFITDTLIPTLQSLYQKWVTEVWPTIQTVTENVWTIIEEIFTELGRWINDNIVPWIDFLKQKWDEDWARIQAIVDTVWRVIKPIWEQIKEWMGVILPPIINALKGHFQTAMDGIRGAIQPVLDLWDNLVGAVQGFWDWITGKVFTFEFKLPDLPDWAIPGSPIPLHTAWKAFADDMDKIGHKLGGGFGLGLGGVSAVSPAVAGGGYASAGRSVVVNIDARGAAKGVDRDVRRVVEDVMREYGLRADMRMRVG